MKTIVNVLVVLIFLLCGQYINGQENKTKEERAAYVKAAKEKEQKQKIESKKEKLKSSIKGVEIQEKKGLKKALERLERTVKKDGLSKEEWDVQKRDLAEKYARNIEDRVVIIKNKIAYLDRNGRSLDSLRFSASLSFGDWLKIDRDWDYEEDDDKYRYDIRTTSDFTFALGFNNAVISGESLEDSPYKIGGSRFFEIGWTWKTRLLKNTNALRLSYGFSFQYNGLNLKDNKYFSVENGETEVLEHPNDLRKSKFRRDNLVFPVYLEFGPSKKTVNEHNFRYSTYRKFKIGIGGYVGVNLSTRQKLKYTKDGDTVKEKLKANYNTNNFIYGLAAYVQLYRNVGLYAKYDLNPIFSDGDIDQRNISLGLKFGI